MKNALISPKTLFRFPYDQISNTFLELVQSFKISGGSLRWNNYDIMRWLT